MNSVNYSVSAKTVGLPLLSIALSAALYAVLDQYTSAHVAGLPPSSLPLYTLLLVRATEWLVLSHSDLGPLEAAGISAAASVPYLYLLNTYYRITLPVLAVSTLVDALSIYVPLRLKTKDVRVHRDLVLSGIQSLTVATAMGVVFYAFTRTQGAFIVEHFEGVKSVIAPPLPLLIAALLPFGAVAATVPEHGIWRLEGLIALEAIIWSKLSDISGISAIALGFGATVYASRYLLHWINSA